MTDTERPSEDELERVIITDYYGNRWNRSEWLEMGQSIEAWNTIAWLTLQIPKTAYIYTGTLSDSEVAELKQKWFNASDFSSVFAGLFSIWPKTTLPEPYASRIRRMQRMFYLHLLVWLASLLLLLCMAFR